MPKEWKLHNLGPGRVDDVFYLRHVLEVGGWFQKVECYLSGEPTSELGDVIIGTPPEWDDDRAERFVAFYRDFGYVCPARRSN